MEYGKYQVLEQVGQGGFGRIYKGFDPLLKRTVAIKVCSLGTAELRARFVREAEIAANLHHPNVVTIFDFGVAGDEPYLVQEYLSGEDLEAVIRRRDALPLARKLEILVQVARGLAFAHAAGVVHRDVKPANIRIQSDGAVRIMDFGIAKLVEADTQITQVGMSVGTIGYLSPEQLRGEPVDHRADIFSFGAMAYELITYEKPFGGDDITAMIYRIVQEEPAPIPRFAPDCPARVIACVERCLRKRRDERYASLAGVIEDLEAAAADLARGAPALPRETPRPDAAALAAAPARKRPALWGFLAAALAVAAFGIVNVARWGETSPGRAGDAPPDDPAAEGGAAAEAGAAATLQPSPASAVAGADPAPPPSTGPAAGAEAGMASGAGARTPASSRAAATTPAAGETPAAAAGAGGGVGAIPPLQARRVLVLLSGPTGALEAAEAAAIRALIDGGAEVVDGEGAAAAVGDGASGISALAQRLLAGTVLIGQLDAGAQPSVGRFFTGSATLNLKSYDGATGRLLGAETIQVGGGQVPGKLGPTAQAAVTEAAAEAGRRSGAAALRRIAQPR